MVQADILDFSFVQGIVSKAIDSLGMAGFVVSILFFLSLVLVLTFRWTHLAQSQRFILVMTLLGMVFALAAYTVIVGDPNVRRNAQPAPPDKRVIAPGFDPMVVTTKTPFEYFSKQLPIPIHDRRLSNKEDTFFAPFYSSSDKKNHEGQPVRHLIYDTTLYIVSLIALDRKDLFMPLAIGVAAKDFSLSNEMLKSIGMPFDASTPIEVAIERLHKKEAEQESQPLVALLIPNLAIAAVRASDKSLRRTYVGFKLADKLVTTGGCAKEGYALYSASETKVCNFPKSRPFAFSRLLSSVDPFPNEKALNGELLVRAQEQTSGLLMAGEKF
ncbi:hypothetical protein [Bradyrhizobium sp. RDI18]|uniref:hypothetical protein n=1 Tax=Bradyrhizobium sp. RDI18 TaxID=3367400 RepID=UPI003716D804